MVMKIGFTLKRSIKCPTVNCAHAANIYIPKAKKPIELTLSPIVFRRSSNSFGSETIAALNINPIIIEENAIILNIVSQSISPFVDLLRAVFSMRSLWTCLGLNISHITPMAKEIRPGI